jgi:glycine/D-amino acid oxidase-like deaminating enzyme
VADRAAIIGGGIIGTTAAALLAEDGADVTLVEATAVAAGASGRNSGTIQHPFDPVLLALHRDTLERYRELAAIDPAFAFPADPAGILLLTDDLAAAAVRATELAATDAELGAEVLDAASVVALEPAIAPGWAAVRVATGYPVVPEAATRAMAARAMRAGATIRIGIGATPWIDGGRLRGVALADGTTLRAGRVLVAAGPWTPSVMGLEPAWPPITRTWGVTVQVELEHSPRAVLEEGVVHTINTPGGHADSLFSLVTADGMATVGSTFLAEEPDPAVSGPLLLERGAAFVPGLADAAVKAIRLCARPQSVDGRPFVGAVPEAEGLFVCAGHGPWGMSTGPASAALVVDLMTGTEDRIPPALRAERAWSNA